MAECQRGGPGPLAPWAAERVAWALRDVWGWGRGPLEPLHVRGEEGGGEHGFIQLVRCTPRLLILWAGPEVEAAGQGALGGTQALSLFVSVRRAAGARG